ncbi:UNVERIFIED_CONTAM: PD-(D/E)XK nuclease domain-containing protein [Wolbachia endosymbiont of Nasonia longicornis]
MFSTAHDTGILGEDERVYFRFDGCGNLKVAVLTNEEDRRIVRCYTIADNENSPGSRFSAEEKQQVEENLPQELQEGEDLDWEEHKIFRFGEECRHFDEGHSFPQRDEYEAPVFHEINPIRAPGELLDLMNELANDNAGEVRTNVKRILQYIVDIHDEHEGSLVFGAESDYHGFLCGFLVNFRYRSVADVYPELLIGKGYADVVLLVRGVNQANDSVPVIIELKVGDEEGLEQAKDYAKSCSVSSLPIHTSSLSAVCVALNFQLRGGAGLRTSVQPFSEGGLSLIPGLLHPHGNGVRGNVKRFLQPIASEFTQSPHCDTFSCMSSFAFGNVLSTADLLRVAGRRRGVIITKYLFNHSEEEKMKRIGGRGNAANIVRHALTLALFVSNIGFVVLHIFRYLRSQTLPDKALDLSLLPQAEDNANVREVLCEVNVQSHLQVLSAKKFESLRAYSRSHREGYFEGRFSEQMGNVRNLHQLADQLMSAEPNFGNDGNVNGEYRARYEVLFNEISRLLSPLLNENRLLVNNEAKFQALLRGIFQSCDNPAKVIIEFQLQRGRKIDLVLSQSTENGDTHPIGVELKYARTAEQVERKRVEADRQLGEYESCGGCKRITGGDAMVLLYAILNAVGQGQNLISIGGLRETREFSR